MKSLRIASYLLSTAIHSLRNAWTLHLVTVGTVAVTFVLAGGALTLFENGKKALIGSGAGSHISIYFRTSGDVEGRAELEKEFCSKPYVRKCSFRSRQDALKDFIAKNPDLKAAATSMEQNPFPASVVFEMDPLFHDERVLRKFAGTLSTWKGVEIVDDGGDWMERWAGILRLATWLMGILGAAFSIALIFVVSNTIALVIYSRRDEIEILNLVGATDFQIRIPFLLEGLIHGIAGSLLALIALRSALWVVDVHFRAEAAGLFTFAPRFLTVDQQIWLACAGAFMGVAGSAVAVGRYLRSP